MLKLYNVNKSQSIMKLIYLKIVMKKMRDKQLCRLVLEVG